MTWDCQADAFTLKLSNLKSLLADAYSFNPEPTATAGRLPFGSAGLGGRRINEVVCGGKFAVAAGSGLGYFRLVVSR
jgi:hypothetical protein